jgi:hypothetical protein
MRSSGLVSLMGRGQWPAIAMLIAVKVNLSAAYPQAKPNPEPLPFFAVTFLLRHTRRETSVRYMDCDIDEALTLPAIS